MYAKITTVTANSETDMILLEKKLQALREIYGRYDNFVEDLKIVCEKHCASCCTCNVTLTTLEGYWIVDRLMRTEQSNTLDRICRLPDGRRFQPKMTTNRMAEFCAEGREIPEEKNDPRWGICALLEDTLCTVYPFRPFGCRCLLSRLHCRESGTADIDAFTVSVNTLFLQVIEHVDADGCSGNLMDILSFLAVETHRKRYEKGALTISDGVLIRNRPLTKLFIPPEYRKRIQPILQSLQEIRI